MLKRYFVFGLGCMLWLGLLGSGAQAELLKEANGVVGGALTTADHSRFAELDKPFVTGPEVTRACLKCHNQAADQVHSSIHWTWESNEGDEKALGKAHVVNNY